MEAQLMAASSAKADAAQTGTGRPSMAWFEHNSNRIYYEEQGSGTPVLLLPGFSQSIDAFAALREALAVAGYRVIAADLPGSGRSEPQPRAYTSTYYEDDARSFGAMLQHLAVGPTHLLGFSDGGEVSVLLAALMPEVARSVVAWGAGGVLNDPSGQLRQAMYNVVDHPIPPLQAYRDYIVGLYGEANARAMTQSHVGALSAIIEVGGDLSLSRADNITAPVLLVAGDHDIFAPPVLATQLAGRIHSAEVLVAEGADHDVYGDRPEWLTHTILTWLGNH
jgi:pimeloyl-ACP methyl ester carboxylesterase